MEFKDKIKGLVAENNMTQRSFAKEIDMEYGYVNKFFTGRTPNMDFLMKVLEVFPEVDLNWLLREEKNTITTIPDTKRKDGTHQDLLTHLQNIEDNVAELRKKMSRE